MSGLSESLLSVGETKLAIQAATSIGYDTQALGLMAVAVALAGVDVALMGALGVLWWLPLPSLVASPWDQRRRHLPAHRDRDRSELEADHGHGRHRR